jgi:hypothetical protein
MSFVLADWDHLDFLAWPDPQTRGRGYIVVEREGGTTWFPGCMVWQRLQSAARERPPDAARTTIPVAAPSRSTTM